VCSATRLKQAGKEVTDEAVEEELAAFERGVNTVPGSQPQGGCIMAQGYRGPPMDVSGMGTCPVRHDGQQQSLPQSPQTGTTDNRLPLHALSYAMTSHLSLMLVRGAHTHSGGSSTTCGRVPFHGTKGAHKRR
jgi:hypothetical protein